MRAEIFVLLVLSLVGPALAASEKVQLGPYNVSFDMNTTSQYSISKEGPSRGMVSDGISFERYNISIDSSEGFAFIVLTGYSERMLAGIEADRAIVESVLQTTGCETPQLFQPAIDRKPGVLASCRFPSGELIVVASYSPDGSLENDEIRAKTNSRIVSTFPWEVTRDMLYTLHIELPQQ